MKLNFTIFIIVLKSAQAGARSMLACNGSGSAWFKPVSSSRPARLPPRPAPASTVTGAAARASLGLRGPGLCCNVHSIVARGASAGYPVLGQ